MKLLRSWMFVPGHVEKMIAKSLGLPVDVAMFDIEDGVLPPDKPAARQLIEKTLTSALPEARPALYVRMNAVGSPDELEDLEAVVQPALDGLLVPKVESVAQVQELAERLGALERRRRMPEGHTRLMVAIESARGLLDAARIASSSDRVTGLMFGAEDYGLDLGLPTIREAEARELLHARSSLVVASAAAKVAAIDGVWPDLGDLDGLVRDSRQARRLGFSGKSLIHPSQIAPINESFNPTAEELEFAREVIMAFEEAESKGQGSIAFRGQLIDRPIVARAYATLELSQTVA